MNKVPKLIESDVTGELEMSMQLLLCCIIIVCRNY